MGNNNRRIFWTLSLSLLIGLALIAVGGQPLSTHIALAQSTQAATADAIPLRAPVCDTSSVVTPALTEGPFYKAGSPESASLLEPGLPGTPIVITGYVLTADCKPIDHAWLDFWQADSTGTYDNTGYRLRGHVYTDKAGRYSLTTILPGEYPGRTEHIHVKIQAANGPILTTQFFFPNVAGNQNDSIFSPNLVLSILDATSGQIVTATPPGVKSATAAATQDIQPVIYTINVILPPQ